MRKFLMFLSKRSFKTLYFLSDIAYYLIYYIVKYRRKVIRKNLINSFPEKSFDEIIVIEKKFYRQFCDQIMEMIKMFTISFEEMDKHFRVENVELIERLRKENKSIFYYLAHIGCWEFLTYFGKATNTDNIYIAYKRLTDATFDQIMYDLRSRFGGHPVQDSKLLRVLNELKKDGIRYEFGFLADQSPLPDALNYWTTFLNQHTAMIDSVERISRRLDVAVCYLEMYRESRGVYKCTAKLITEDINSTPQNYVTEKYTRLLEETIKKQPECFLWSHNRWKYKPEDSIRVKK